jgi:hypothetical protein
VAVKKGKKLLCPMSGGREKIEKKNKKSWIKKGFMENMKEFKKKF